jgi:SAM-dependent methyltransferase
MRRLVSKAFFHAGRSSYLLSTLLHSCGISTLSLAELRAGIPEHWQDFNSDESEIDAGLHPHEAWFADQWVRAGATALIAGCGSGREIVAFLARGCRVTGVDPASRALDIARQLLGARGLTADLIEGFIDETPASGPFDVIVFANNTYNLIPEGARRIQTLRRLATQLKPGGVIYVDHQALMRPRPIVIRTARLAARIARSDWRLEPGDLVGWAQRDGRPLYSYGHAFTPEEIEREARSAGLRILAKRDSPENPVYVLQA